MLKKFSIVIALLVIGGLATATVLIPSDPDLGVVLPDPIDRDLGDILERDTLVALTSYTSTSYFLYRGQPFGFEYELLRDFAEDQDVVFDIKVVPRDSILYYLNAGLGDIAAARLQPVEEDTSKFGFTQNLYQTTPVVVQRRGDIDTTAVEAPEVPAALAERVDQQDGGDVAREPLKIRARPIRRPADLAGQEVFLPNDDPYVDRLVELENELTGDIAVVEVDTTSEALIRNVAVGNIELTVAQENVAELEAGYYDNLVVQPAVGAPHGVAWAVRDNAPDAEPGAQRVDHREPRHPELEQPLPQVLRRPPRLPRADRDGLPDRPHGQPLRLRRPAQEVRARRGLGLATPGEPDVPGEPVRAARALVGRRPGAAPDHARDGR